MNLTKVAGREGRTVKGRGKDGGSSDGFLSRYARVFWKGNKGKKKKK